MNGDNLREALRRHAADAPPGSGLLDAVKTRSRDRRRRRRLAIAGAAAVAVAVTAPAVVRGIGSGPDRPAPPPAGQQTPASPEVEPTGATTLVPAPEFELPDFPFTPTWIPPGLTEASSQYSSIEFGDTPGYPGGAPPLRAEPGVAVIHTVLDSEDTGRSLSKLETQFEGLDEDEPTAQVVAVRRQRRPAGGPGVLGAGTRSRRGRSSRTSPAASSGSYSIRPAWPSGGALPTGAGPSTGPASALPLQEGWTSGMGSASSSRPHRTASSTRRAACTWRPPPSPTPTPWSTMSCIGLGEQPG